MLKPVPRLKQNMTLWRCNELNSDILGNNRNVFRENFRQFWGNISYLTLITQQNEFLIQQLMSQRENLQFIT